MSDPHPFPFLRLGHERERSLPVSDIIQVEHRLRHFHYEVKMQLSCRWHLETDIVEQSEPRILRMRQVCHESGAPVVLAKVCGNDVEDTRGFAKFVEDLIGLRIRRLEYDDVVRR